MRIVTLKKNFKILSDLKLLELARNVLASVNEPIQADSNLKAITIPNLVPNYSEMVDLVDAFDAALLAFMNRGRIEKVMRDLKRGQLENALKLWAMQIEVFANGDMEILINSGFELSKQPEPQPHPGAPVGFTVTSTGTGELTLLAKKIKGVSAFVFEIKEVDTTHSMICTQGNSKCIQRNLKSGACYESRVAYIAKNELKVYSDYKRCFVQ